MKPEELMEKYPAKFEHVISCDYPPGWDKMIESLVDLLSDTCRIVQIKEKFGGLRCYVDDATERDNDLIAAAEEKSREICDTCGEGPTFRREGNWLSYACDRHQKI